MHHDRDINAAKNILAAGLAVAVCGATVRPEQSKSVKAGAKSPRGRKQKPKSWVLGIPVRLRRGGGQHTTIITWLKAVGKLLPDACTREQIPDVGSRR
jgi:hypothetical protein